MGFQKSAEGEVMTRLIETSRFVGNLLGRILLRNRFVPLVIVANESV